MPLPESTPRKKIHRREIICDGYQREDGLWDIDAHIADTKTYAFDNDYRGTIEPGEELHGMWLRLTIDGDMVVQDCIAVTDNSPYKICGNITPVFKKLIGEKIGPGWTRRVKELVGGVSGCTHLADLLGPATTTAIQSMAGVRRTDNSSYKSKPFFVDGCHAWRSDGPMVTRYFPEFSTRENAGNKKS